MENIKKRIIRKLLPYSHIIKEKIWRIKWFNNKQDKSNFVGLISCIDGRVWHGGMCDRFKGILSTYYYCKENNIPFRIKYDFPFNLSDYLVPNKYDWELKENEYSETYKKVEILYIVAESSSRRMRIPVTTQIHVYANRDTLPLQNSNVDWGEVYNELFKPSEKLDIVLRGLNWGEYVALVFRFQNLIGDFKEYAYKALEGDEKEELLKKCEKAVDDFLLRFPDSNILVTSDSITFLEIIKNKLRVKIIPGEVVHIDTHGNGGSDYAYMKSFIDFYMISRANKVFSVGTEIMYPSEFPMYAAKLNKVPFERVIIK